MTLEDRLTNALRQVDLYEPSVDLFARTTRSIEEDRNHRRRLLIGVAWTVLAIAAVGVFLAAVIETGGHGALIVPRWAVVTVQVIISAAVVISLAPMIRRYGHPFVDAAFHMSPETGRRFSTLLDLAYYLSFSGLIVISINVTTLEDSLSFPAETIDAVFMVARLLAAMGVAHALNLLAIPIVGLIFGSVVRRSKRRAAGNMAPPLSLKAEQADRVAAWIVYAMGGWIVANLLVLIGLIAGGILIG